MARVAVPKAFLFMVVVILIAVVWAAVAPWNLAAQERGTTFRSLLEQINTQFDQPARNQRLVSFHFRTPLVENEYVWTLGQEENPPRVISEIGDDYLCFQETGGGVRFVRCTPFENIVSVSYIEN